MTRKLFLLGLGHSEFDLFFSLRVVCFAKKNTLCPTKKLFNQNKTGYCVDLCAIFCNTDLCWKSLSFSGQNWLIVTCYHYSIIFNSCNCNIACTPTYKVSSELRKIWPGMEFCICAHKNQWYPFCSLTGFRGSPQWIFWANCFKINVLEQPESKRLWKACPCLLLLNDNKVYKRGGVNFYVIEISSI